MHIFLTLPWLYSDSSSYNSYEGSQKSIFITLLFIFNIQSLSDISSAEENRVCIYNASF